MIAAGITFRKEMKLSIGARCQATANESGVKPPHSKLSHGCNLQTDACRTHSLCAPARRVHPTIYLAINLIFGGLPANPLGMEGLLRVVPRGPPQVGFLCPLTTYVINIASPKLRNR